MTSKIDWHERAACKTGHADMFFEETRKSIVRKAKEICAKCPVKKICLEHAITADEIGVWGGKTTNERRKMRRLRKSLKKELK